MKRLKETDPPKLAQAMLRALLDPRERDTVTGDLLEEYRDRIARGRDNTARWYIRQVLSFVNGASLRRALLPGCLAWVAAATVTEFVVFFFAPWVVGIAAEWAVLSFIAALLVMGGVCAVGTSATRRIVSQTTILWMLPFLVTAYLTLRLPSFTPVPGVAAFFLCATAAGLHASERTGKVNVGIAAATAIGSLIAVFTAFATVLLHHPHPPFSSFPFVPGAAAIAGAIGGIFGSRLGRFSRAEPERMSITN